MTLQSRKHQAQKVGVAANDGAGFNEPIDEQCPDWFWPPARDPNAAE